MTINTLEELKQVTTIVIDSADFNSALKYRPTDATTNPSLILAACRLPQYNHLITSATEACHGSDSWIASDILDKIVVNFGVEYLKIIPGRISTEIDAKFSYDIEETIKKAKKIVKLYNDAGISKDRVLIKVAGTWKGIQAVKMLEQEGIKCNVTLIFSPVQAIAAAEAGATLISPFVGRVSDWYKKHPEEAIEGVDMGVELVRAIYTALKSRHSSTKVMAASFRTTQQILDLSGIDLMTISPTLLEELSSANQNVDKSAITRSSGHSPFKVPKDNIDASSFETLLAKNKMAYELLTDGIKRFENDAGTLEDELISIIKKA